MTTKHLTLLRHAKSDWHSGAQTDHDRPLSKRGRNDANRMGHWFNEYGYIPQRILCSTACRTRETLERVADSAAWGDPDTTFDESLYLGSESTIVSIISTELSTYDQLLIIGHNPGMDNTLLGFCPYASPTDNHKLMTTAAVAIIEFSDSALSDPTLIEFQRPSELP